MEFLKKLLNLHILPKFLPTFLSHPEQSEGSFSASFLLAFLTRESSPKRQDALEYGRYTQNDRAFKAFTLAEVLITLGIIGVVAALTIPTLIKNSEKLEQCVRAKSIYSILSQASIGVANDNGGTIKGMTGTSYINELSTKLSFATKCSSTDSSCWHGINKWYDYDGSIYPLAGSVKNGALILKNGMLINFQASYPLCDYNYGKYDICNIFYIDTNGFKPPNKMHNDILLLLIRENGFVYDKYGIVGKSEQWDVPNICQ